jgi:hypothetical protein
LIRYGECKSGGSMLKLAKEISLTQAAVDVAGCHGR